MTLRDYDVIVINSSGGKDSQAMLDTLVAQARDADVMDRVCVVHCTFTEEWAGTVEIAEAQAAHYGLPCRVVQHPLGSLLKRIERRGRWPSAAQRYCTAEFKRNQAKKVITQFVHAHRAYRVRPVRVLNCQGMRAAESNGRRKRGNARPQVDGAPCWVEHSGRVSTTTIWWPIFRLSLDDVWTRVRAAGTPVHPAYALGMPRLSCVFCVLAPPAALALAGRHNPELLEQYVDLERRMGHRFTQKFAIADIQSAIARGDDLGPITTWEA